jgi:hypothetical protein
MAQLVYIREIHPRSFLYFTTNGEGFRLRDFSQPRNGPAVELCRQSEGRTASTIREMARKSGNHLIDLPGQGKSIDDYAFWYDQTTKLNTRYLEPPSPQPTSDFAKSWMLENFTKVVVGVVTAVLIAVVLAWMGLKP